MRAYCSLRIRRSAASPARDLPQRTDEYVSSALDRLLASHPNPYARKTHEQFAAPSYVLTGPLSMWSWTLF